MHTEKPTTLLIFTGRGGNTEERWQKIKSRELKRQSSVRNVRDNNNEEKGWHKCVIYPENYRQAAKKAARRQADVEDAQTTPLQTKNVYSYLATRHQKQ